MSRNTDRLNTKTTRRQNNTLIHCPGEKSNRSSRCGAETRSVGAPQPDDQDNTPHLGCTDSKEKNQDNKPEFALIGLQPASSSSSDALQLVAMACNPVKAHSINTASTTLKQDCGLVEELITIILLNAAIRRMRMHRCNTTKNNACAAIIADSTSG